MPDKPLVTISIPTLNSAAFLGDCLAAVSRQTYSAIEVNIVDGNSTDETITVALAHGVRHVATHPGALLGARLLGAREAKGKYILLLDSDQVLKPTTVEDAVRVCEAGSDMLVLGADCPVWQIRTLQPIRTLRPL